MKQKNFRLFIVDGKEMRFDINKFKELFNRTAKENKKKIGSFEKELADGICVSEATVHTWRNGNSGPGDIETIKGIATFFGCEYASLMLEDIECSEGENIMNTHHTISDSERSAINRVYQKMLDFVRIIEVYHGTPFDDFPGEIMEKYYEIVEDIETEPPGYWVALDERFDDLQRILESELVMLGGESYSFLGNVLLNLYTMKGVCIELMEVRQAEMDGNEEELLKRLVQCEAEFFSKFRNYLA